MASVLLAVAILATFPGLYLELVDLQLAPTTEAAIFGLTILGAAFLLAWAAEVAQVEISQALAVAILAVIAILPEYAVDLYFAWVAADRPEYAAYATANMTGANRLLVGLGWPLVVLLFWARFRKPGITLDKAHSAEVSYLLLASLYSFLIPIKGSLSLIDTAILLLLFAAYAWRIAHSEVEEPRLAGPAALLGSLTKRARRVSTVGLFLFSGLVILLVAEAFAEALVASGEALGVDEYLLVQWVAPIASEAPEFIIASLWALQSNAQAGLGALISSKVNQWTLLIGTIPLVYSVSAGGPSALPLDLRQEHELWLTGTQSLLAVALLANLQLGVAEAALLLGLFLAQFIVPEIRIEVAIAYTALAILYLVRRRRVLPGLLRFGLLIPPKP